LQPNDKNPEDQLIQMIASVVPILNGKDSAGQVIHLGPRMLRTPRYLLVILAAKSGQMFRLEQGKELDGSVYFSLYGLGQVADSFKQRGPHHQPIQYERTRVANRIYTMISNRKGLVAMRKIDGAICVKLTETGVKTSNEVLQEIIAYDNTRRDSDGRFKAKGVKGVGLQGAQKRLAEKIYEINFFALGIFFERRGLIFYCSLYCPSCFACMSGSLSMILVY
jgi:hypothetical protein